jgi:hypothetical protein
MCETVHSSKAKQQCMQHFPQIYSSMSAHHWTGGVYVIDIHILQSSRTRFLLLKTEDALIQKGEDAKTKHEIERQN